MRLFLGVDPGVSGGWAAITEDRQVVLGSWKDLAQTVIDLMAVINPSVLSLKAVLEDVHSSPQMGVRSAFTFGMSRGMWEAILHCLQIPYELVSPMKWQTALRCRSHGDKRVTRLRARELYPQIAKQITHATADALLLAEYNLRTSTGQI